MRELAKEMREGQTKIMEKLHDFHTDVNEKLARKAIRLDRLEQIEEGRRRTIGFLGAGLGASLIKMLFDFFHVGGPK